MQRDLTKQAYAERIDRVLTHVAADLDRRHSLEDLAGVAAFSPFHFHRIYRAITGETVEETVRRLRLHRAAYELNATTQPIARIARRAGYGSTAAFNRAFASAYGRPPGSYRRARCPDASRRHIQRQELPMYPIDIGQTARHRLVGLDHKGDYNNIGATFDRLSAIASAKGLFSPGSRMFGIYFDDPKATPKSELRSFAGLTAPEGYEPDSGLRVEVIEAGPAAELLHKGPYAELEQAYDYLFREWLPGSGREPADRPPFEEYLNNPRELPPTEWLTRLSIPLK